MPTEIADFTRKMPGIARIGELMNVQRVGPDLHDFAAKPMPRIPALKGRRMTKSLLLSTALVLGTVTLCSAGGLGKPVMTTEVIKENTSSSSHDFIVPLFLLLVIAAAVDGR